MGRFWRWVGLGGAIALLILWLTAPASPAAKLPEPRSHPLPAALQQLTAPMPVGQAASDSPEDYFDAIEPTPVGALVWSRFPVTVAIQDNDDSQWRQSVRGAIADWAVYFPLVETADPDTADIVVMRSRPPRTIRIDREQRRLIIPDAQHGQARYTFYLERNPPPHLAHRFTPYLNPDQPPHRIQGTARHELGHALGLWGHSPNPNDALYPSQVSDPPPISRRDLLTLRRIYQAPTRLGWPIQP
jgi:predicted Zn-dependent protease